MATANRFVKPWRRGVNFQVVLDEKTETFNDFVLWLFHSPDFVVTEGRIWLRPLADVADNVEALLRLAHKYEIPTLSRDVAVPTNSFTIILIEQGISQFATDHKPHLFICPWSVV